MPDQEKNSAALSLVRPLVGPKRSPSQVVSLHFGTDDNHSARHPASISIIHFFPSSYILYPWGKGKHGGSGVFGLNVDGGERSPFLSNFIAALPPPPPPPLGAKLDAHLLISLRRWGEERGWLGFFFASRYATRGVVVVVVRLMVIILPPSRIKEDVVAEKTLQHYLFPYFLE